ncbi:MAG TPA: hypothetical protein VF816_13950 [Rhodocyclaceae bacterium]
MIDPKAMSDDVFLAAFLDASMPPSGFDHLGHLRAAWILLQRRPLEAAIEECCDGIARLAARLGVPGKYNRTLSEGLLRMMAAGGAARLPWEEFLRANPDLVADARGCLARHYSDERLAGGEARLRFATPDRLPLPSCPA